MIVVNKCVKSHNSLGMISKVTEIYNKPAPSCPELTKLPRRKDGRRQYNEAYNALYDDKKKCLLSPHDFRTNLEYVHALEHAKKYVIKKELNEFIKESVNGGFAYDEMSVML